MRFALFTVFVLSNILSYSQNLVPNPSFESFNTCPTIPGSVELPSTGYPVIQGWNKATNANPDYYNTCASITSLCAIPSNLAGFQYPRTGEAYIGSYVTNRLSYHEYMQAKLVTPLTNDHHYYVGYWITLANGTQDNLAGIDQLGVLFHPDSIETGFTMPVLTMYSPQVVSPYGLTYKDTVNWMKVSGSFKAAGDERWMIMGSFLNDVDLTFDYYIDSIPPTTFAYYYYDDICVLDLDAPYENVEEVYICSPTPVNISTYLGLDSNYRIWDGDSLIDGVTITQSGEYPVRIVNENNCSRKDYLFRVDIGIREIEIPLGNDTMICPGSTIRLEASDERFSRYTWNTGDTTAGIMANGAGVYSVRALGDCYAGSGTIRVSDIPLPVLDLGRDTVICMGTSTYLRPDMIPSNVSEYFWNTGNNECCITVSDSGQYILKAEDICGRTIADTVVVDVANCDHCLILPTAFTPNADGVNDAFRVLTSCLFSEYDMKVFNRWGNLVFRSFKATDQWDGTFRGQPQDAGVYYYIIEAIPYFEGAQPIIRKGEITLLR